MAGRVEGKVAFITGAARGQGRSHAIRLAEEGADIIAVDICKQVESVSYPLATSADLDETVREVQSRGRRIIGTQVDVRDLHALQDVVDLGVAEFGRLDIVSANAGIGSHGPLKDMSEQTWTEMIDINLSGVWHTAKVAIPHLIKGGRGGSIVITSSSAGLRVFSNIGHYAAAKHGLVGLMRTLALELAPHMIRVNSLHPTSVNTDIIHNDAMYALFRPDLEHPKAEDIAEHFRALNALPIPWVESIDISNAVLFLSSEEARYITGVALPIDAGCLLR
jgi:(+)-trans-carveol dehydrogenase